MMKLRLTWIAATLLAASFGWQSVVQAAPTHKQLTIGTSQEFENMNPTISQMSASSYLYYMVGHPLVAVNDNWEWQCWLCTELPTIENGKAELITVKGEKKIKVQWQLKKGVKWGDGKPVTAKDVKTGWEIGLDPSVSTGSKDVYQKIESIELDPKDPLKFTMTFKEARYDYYQLGQMYILPDHLERPVFEKTKGKAGAYEKQTVYTTDPTNKGLYNGPYTVKEVKLGSHMIFERNEHYYGKRPAFDRIIVKLIPNTQTLEANLLSGNIDMISNLGLTFDQALAFEKRLKKDANLSKRYKVDFVDGMVYEHIDLNLRNPILAEVDVRKALVYSIDRDKLTQALFEGRQKKALSMIHPRDIYYTEDVVKYDYNPKKAGELLDRAGWKVGKDKYRYKDGKKLQITLMTTSQNKTRELVQVFLKEEWRKVGVDIQIKNEPARVYFGETVRKAKYTGMAMYAWISAPDNPPKSTLHSEEIPTSENGYSGQNSAGWRNKEVDKALDEILVTFDPEKRKELMVKVQKAYTDEVPVIPLYMRADISVTPVNLKGYKLPGHMYHPTLRIDEWYLDGLKAGE